MPKKPIKDHKIYHFKKGQILDLDAIYAIQGLFDGREWWEPIPDPESESGEISGETIQILQDVTIEIIKR